MPAADSMYAPLVDVPTRPLNDAGHGVDEHRLLDLRKVALLVEHPRRRADADERAERVEEATSGTASAGSAES